MQTIQPNINSLQQQSAALHLQQHQLAQTAHSKANLLQNYQQQGENMRRETDVQARKNKSLVVLVAELYRQYDEVYLQTKHTPIYQPQLINHQQSLKSLLVKQVESLTDTKALHQFIKKLIRNKNKPIQLISHNAFIQNQLELIAKLKSKIDYYNNGNYECRRKWAHLNDQSIQLRQQIKNQQIQLQRQKVQIKDHYQEYLEKVNDSKTKLFQQTNNVKSITEYLVQEMALLQSKRLSIEQQHNNLQYHKEILKEELTKIQIENRQFKSFFQKDGQESKLANKLKTRIQQLRDTLIQEEKKNQNAKLVKLSQILQNLRKEYQQINEANDYKRIKLKEEMNGSFDLDEKDIVGFFTKICQSKDQQIQLLSQQQDAIIDSLQQAKIKKQLLQNQIMSLQQALSLHSAQQNYKETTIQKQITKKSNFYTFNKNIEY